MTIEELQQQRRWLLWRLEPSKDGKPTKVPYQPNGYKASLLNPKHLHTYAELCPHVANFTGIGLALGEFDGVAVWGVDIDNCCDAVTGEFSPESRQVVIGLDSYAEFSPSGTGCHIWGIGKLFGKGLQKPFPGCKQIEVKGLGYYHTYTGRHLSKTPGTLEDRQGQITALYNRVAGQVVPRKAGLVFTIPVSEEERFKKLWAGDMTAHNDDHSAADFALCVLLAKKHKCNAFKVDSDFRESGLYREKWERDDYRENTITRAISAVFKDTPILENTEDPIDDDSPREYLVEALPGPGNEGWFPKGEVSLIGGSSGTGKTSWSIPILEKIRKGEHVYGHTTKPRDYRVLLNDRSRKGTLATLNALRLPKEAIDRCIRLTTSQQQSSPSEILAAFVEQHPGAETWFIEGLDMWLTDLYDMQKVSTVMDGLQRIALRHNVAIVATVGSPKMKSKDGKYSGRDNLFGSVALGRKAETVVLFQLHDSEDVNSVVVCTVLCRCGKPEKFYLAWGDGGLQLTAKPEQKPVGRPATKGDVLRFNIFAKFKPGERILFSSDLCVSEGTYYTWLEKAVSEGVVDKRGGIYWVPS
jgi:hypothetical protein